MGSLNSVRIIGHLGRDPEIRTARTGRPVANLGVATHTVFIDRFGKWQHRTVWHRIVLFGRSAENCAQFLTKGERVFVEGRLRTRAWIDRSGVERQTTEIVARTVRFLGG